MATLYSVVRTLQSIALQQPNIRTVGENKLYEDLNGNPELKFGVFYVTQGQHKSSGDFDIWSFHLFVIDRIMDNKENELRVESTAKQTLDNIITTFCARYNADVTGERKYNPFIEKFKDICGGVWVDVSLIMPKDIICPE